MLIWESLGGDQDWEVRFFAQHSAIVYFFVLVLLWVFSPTLAYNFSELIEAHAVDTYAEFAEANKEILMALEAPPVAKNYYEAVDMYVFDEFQTGRPRGSRRPIVNSLYDVVCNIRDDEAEHVTTMAACQDSEVLLRSPNTEAAMVGTAVAAAALAIFISGLSGGGLVEEGFEKALTGLADDASAAASGAAARALSSFTQDASTAASGAVDELGNAAGEEGVKNGIAKLPALQQLGRSFTKFLSGIRF